MNTLKQVIPTAALALAAAFATSTVLAETDASSRQSATDEATNPSTQAVDSSDRVAANMSQYPSASGDASSNSSPDAMPAPSGSSDTTIGASSAPDPVATSSGPSPEPESVQPGPDEPRYVPETGNAEYGPKLNPDAGAPGALTPPNRFNDATGQ